MLWFAEKAIAGNYRIAGSVLSLLFDGIMAGLQSSLADLYGCLNTDNPSLNAQKAHDIAGDVGHVCLQDVTEKDIGMLEILGMNIKATHIIAQQAIAPFPSHLA